MEYKVLTEYELGRCWEAIKAVSLLGKPIAEVKTQQADKAELEADLEKCLEYAARPHRVKYWILEASLPPPGPRYRYGFYREAWALHALIFLERDDLSFRDHSWISGLLFGYQPQEIQKFISRRDPARKKKKK